MNETLYERFTAWLYLQQRKHDLGEDYVERYVNEMSNYEFLQELSRALEQMETRK
jgi:hypothetical protein